MGNPFHENLCEFPEISRLAAKETWPTTAIDSERETRDFNIQLTRIKVSGSKMINDFRVHFEIKLRTPL